MGWLRRKKAGRVLTPAELMVLRRIRREQEKKHKHLREQLKDREAWIEQFLGEYRQIRETPPWDAAAWSVHLRGWESERDQLREELGLEPAEPLPACVYGEQWPDEEER